MKPRASTRLSNGPSRPARRKGPAAHSAPVEQRAFDFLEINRRQEKPRSIGLTEIRGPYYTPLGLGYLNDLLESMSAHIDSLKFAGGSFALMPRRWVRALLQTAHEYRVEVSTGGFIERVLTMGQAAVEKYIGECAELGFDTLEVSAGFISLPIQDWVRLVRAVEKAGLKAKPEVGIQFGAGGASAEADLQRAGTTSPRLAIEHARRFLDAGATLIMLESEGITENVSAWRADVPLEFANALGLEHVMFEAADPEVFGWYIKNFGPEVNLFVDHSQVVQLEALRRGIWGTSDLWGRVVTFKPGE